MRKIENPHQIQTLTTCTSQLYDCLNTYVNTIKLITKCAMGNAIFATSEGFAESRVLARETNQGNYDYPKQSYDKVMSQLFEMAKIEGINLEYQEFNSSAFVGAPFLKMIKNAPDIRKLRIGINGIYYYMTQGLPSLRTTSDGKKNPPIEKSLWGFNINSNNFLRFYGYEDELFLGSTSEIKFWSEKLRDFIKVFNREASQMLNGSDSEWGDL